jgi:RNA polymerase sigma-70 factor (ECF subfamily)
MTMETESALVAAARLGNRQAFEQLYRFTAPTLTNCARRLSRNEADDLVQATYLRALRAMRSFRGECRVLTWLCTILRNEANTRTQYTTKHPTTELLDIFEAPGQNLDAFVDLQKALSVLSHTDRELMLRHLHGYRDSEIAGQLGLPGNRSTLRVQMWRAQRKMRSALMRPEEQNLPPRC